MMAPMYVSTNIASLVSVVVPLVVLCFELPRRLGVGEFQPLEVRKSVRTIAKELCSSVPEILTLSLVLTFALLLRLRGDQEVLTNPVEIQVWEDIKREWPILMGADTLLNLQAMLRLTMYVFAVFRAHASTERAPLSGLPATFALSAVLARASLAAQTRGYALEGPLSLGGDLPVMCELAMVPLLSKLSIRALRSAPICAVSVISLTTMVAAPHYLNLASNPGMDRLFTLAHALEVVASVAFLFRTVEIQSDPQNGSKGKSKGPLAVGFLYLVMIVQQACSAYYFLTAFTPSQALVGAGRPFCLLCLGNLLQLAAYVCSGAFFLGGTVGSWRQGQEDATLATLAIDLR